MLTNSKNRVRKNDFGLTLVFSENQCEEDGIHVSFLTTEKIIISNFKEKVKIRSLVHFL